jgi:hypothetical protein
MEFCAIEGEGYYVANEGAADISWQESEVLFYAHGLDE